MEANFKNFVTIYFKIHRIAKIYIFYLGAQYKYIDNRNWVFGTKNIFWGVTVAADDTGDIADTILQSTDSN